MTKEMVVRWLEQLTVVEPYADDEVLVTIAQAAIDVLNESVVISLQTVNPDVRMEDDLK